jgi:two-component system, LytTR family, sensor histidine kinase AlgZ
MSLQQPAHAIENPRVAPRHDLAYWFRIATVNALGAVVAFGILGGLVAEAPWSLRWRGLGASFIYANCIGGTCALAMPPLLRRFGSRSRTARWVTRLIALPALIVFGCAVAGVFGIAIGLIGPSEYLGSLRSSLWISLVVGTVATLAVVAYETLRGQLEAATIALRTKERDEADARRVAAETRLASLESRVNPHFLFNTLNSIAALTHENPSGAERMTNQLASLMRSSLDAGSAALVPLGQEVRVVRDYLEIERVRFGDRLRFTLDVPDEVRERLVPRLSLQTLVENSVKFAVSPRREGGSIAVRGAVTEAGLRLEVEDDGPGFEPALLPDGHGLALLKERLAMTFGERARLDVDSRPGRTLVAIEIPWSA